MRTPKIVQNRAGLWWILAALAALVAATYWPVARFQFVNWDDPEYVSSNLHVLGGLTRESVLWAATHEVSGNWHPLTMLSHMLDVTMFGPDAGAHHVVNVLLHIGATLLLFAALKQMTGATGRSAFVAAVFGAHPLHVESVAWISERKDVLSTVLVMATLCGYAWYVRARSWKRYLAVVALYALALTAKPMVVTLPAVLLLLDVWPLKRATWPWVDRSGWLSLIGEKGPLFLSAFLVTLLTFRVQGDAVAGITALPLAARGANAIINYGRYIAKALWPSSLSAFYPLETYPASPVIAVAVALGAAMGVALWMARRHPFVLTGWLWFVVTLLPVCGLLQTGDQAIADRYMYFPIVGLAIIVAWGAEVLRHSAGFNALTTRATAALVVLVAAVVAREQVLVWADSETLWRHAIAVNQRNHRAFDKLAEAQRHAGALDEAAANYRRALELAPANSPLYLAMIHNSLGIVAVRQDRREEAVAEFAEAVRLNGRLSEAQGNLGAALATQGRVDEAAVHYAEAVRLTPDSAEARLGLAGVRLSQGRADEALRLYDETIAMTPAMAEAHAGKAAAAAALHNAPLVYAELAEAIRLKPDLASAHVRLAQQLAADGRLTEAVGELQTAIALTPNPAWQQALNELRARIK